MRTGRLRLPRSLLATVIPLTASISIVVLTAVTAAVLATASGCDTIDTRLDGQIRIATGSPTAVYYRYGTTYANLIHAALPRTTPTVLTTAASAENVLMVARGQADVGFTQSDIVTSTAPAGSIAALARIYDDCLHLVVRADSVVKALPDLRGRPVSIGENGSGTALTAERVLTVAGLDPAHGIVARRLGLDDSVSALRAGSIDAFFFSGGLPVAAVARLSAALPIRLIGLREYVLPLRRAYGDHYTERVVPSSVYGVAPAVSIGIPNYIVVPRSMSTAMAYALTTVLFDGRDRLAGAHPAGAGLNQRSAISTPPLDLHPGAARYYRSVKA